MASPGLPSLPRFEPATEPLWQRVHVFLRGVEPGRDVLWSDLSAALKYGDGPRDILIRAWNKAAGELEAEGWSFETVGDTGFRVTVEMPGANAGRVVEGSVEPTASFEGHSLQKGTEPTGQSEDVPKWRRVYERLKGLETGEVLSWEEIATLVGRGPNTERYLLTYPVTRAKRELLRADRLVVLPVRGVGYKVATPGQQLDLAHRHQQRAAKEVNKGLSLVEAVDPAKLDEETRKGFAAVGLVLHEQSKVIGALSGRQQRIEEVIAVVEERTAAREQELAKTTARVTQVEEMLRQMLSGNGGGIPGAGPRV